MFFFYSGKVCGRILLMNDFDKYNENLIDTITAHGYLITETKQINYGIMYRTVKDNITSVIRVYQNKKGKITLDTSAVKDEKLTDILLGYSGETRKEDILLPPPLIGTDEAGKGDFFGSLTVCGIYADKNAYKELEKLGVKDSKKLTDEKMMRLSEEILIICPDYALLEFTPEKLNALHKKMNTNAILGTAHAKVIAKLHMQTGCTDSLSDKFADEKLILDGLKNYGVSINARQYPRAEANAAVAAASIIARCKFIKSINIISEKYGMDVPLGAGEIVDNFGAEFVKKYGMDELAKISKSFFKNTLKIKEKL
ncbi:MAG: ribonuclease HIII [Anaerofustis stercorihominis]|nr:ribonuclease HIII [Anaerofustis stercorihominis]